MIRPMLSLIDYSGPLAGFGGENFPSINEKIGTKREQSKQPIVAHQRDVTMHYARNYVPYHR